MLVTSTAYVLSATVTQKSGGYVPLACRLDVASRRAGRRMSFGTMKRFMVEGKFGRIVLVPAGGKSAVAARVPRSVATDRVAEGLEMIVTAMIRSDIVLCLS